MTTLQRLFGTPVLPLLLLSSLLIAPPIAGAGGEVPDDLPPRFRDWLAEVELLITAEERAYFLTLTQDFRRDAFVAEFWRQRDPFDDTRLNELQLRWEERAERARSEFGSLADARSRILLTNGEPINRCWHLTQELEIWSYAGSDQTLEEFLVLFYRYNLNAPYRIWLPGENLVRTSRRRVAEIRMIDSCQEDVVAGALKFIEEYRLYESLIARIQQPPERPSNEWVATFAAQTSELPAGAQTFPAELDFDFPGRHQQRTVVQGVVAVPAAAVAAAGAGEGAGEGDSGDAVYQLQLTGEVVRDGALFESFRYRFEIPAHAAPEGGGEELTLPLVLPLVFQRYLRPGEATVLLKVEDLIGRRFAHLERVLEVPAVEGEAAVPGLADSELGRLLAEADAATARGERVIRLVPPPGVVHTGLVRFNTVTTGEIDRVSFLLDDQEILTKNRPPYSVELDLGGMPGTHRLRVRAFAAGGDEVAGDEILLNPGGQRFRVRLVEPRPGRYRRSVRAVADVDVPDGAELDRVELYLDEERVATLYQPPFVQPVVLPDDQLAYLRAVAFLRDGSSSEEVVFINAPEGLVDEVDVQLVELYATVYDRAGRPVTRLERDRFTVAEDGVPQQIRRFEWVSDLPIHTALLIDTSASMAGGLATVGEAARAFVEQTVETRDRAALITFATQPYVAVRFTNDVPSLTAALRAMRAEGGTALYDSLVFALHYFNGIKGQRALLLLSDGKDEASGFDFARALEYAHRAGVTLYTIGIEAAGLDRGSRKVLRQLAEETGGRSFFVDDVGELAAVYREIEEELRAQYLIAYQSSSRRDRSEFRRVAVTVSGDEPLEVRAMSGYYP